MSRRSHHTLPTSGFAVVGFEPRPSGAPHFVWAPGKDYVDRLELSATEVHRFVARRVANRADAADIAQQTLLLACEKLDTFRGESLSGWLFTIARHLIVDHYRARKRFQFVEVEGLAETEPALQTPSDAVWVACEGRARVSGWVDCITRRLRVEEQVAVLLADIYDHRDKDSAALLYMSRPSFKLLLHGARARLHGVAGGKCTVVRQTNGSAGDESACNRCHERADFGSGGPACVQPTHRVGVICRLGAAELLALRRRLLEGLDPEKFSRETVVPPSDCGLKSDSLSVSKVFRRVGRQPLKTEGTRSRPRRGPSSALAPRAGAEPL